MEPTGKQLAGKVIIITGSTDGIGLAMARQCVLNGARVLIHGRDKSKAESIVKEFPELAAFCISDLADTGSAQQIVHAALNAFGELHGLVNNAASICRSDLQTTDAALFDEVMAVNVRAPMLLIQTALSHLKKTHGSIVNIGSVNAYTGEPRQLAYSMSKAALMTMSRNLANVLAPELVRVTHFNVGWVLTENERKLKISEGLPTDWHVHPETEHVPTGRMTQPEEVARHIAFWLSDLSRPISGSVIDLEQYPVIGRIPLKEGDKPDA